MTELSLGYYWELGAGLGVVVVMTLAAAYLVGRLRDRAGDDETSPSDLMTKFREMHSQGDLSESEYRTIKTVLTAQFQEELNGTGGKG